MGIDLMNKRRICPPKRWPRRWAWCLLVALIGMQTGVLRAAAASDPSPAVLLKTQAKIQTLAWRRRLATDWWQQIYGPISAVLGDQRRMIQVSAVAAVLGLFIIWWRK